MTIASDIQKLDPGSIVYMYELDATSLGGVVSRYHPGVNKIKQSVVWQANTYLPWPITTKGFDKTTKGKNPRPRLIIAEKDGLIASELALYDDLVGAVVTRKRTLVKYLDAINFDSGNPQADPNEFFPDDVFVVERKPKETKEFVELELVSTADVAGVKLPNRQIIQNICPWVYRSPECSYAGGAVAKKDDTATSNINEDKCGKRLVSCELRFGANQPLPFGGFPGAGLIR